MESGQIRRFFSRRYPKLELPLCPDGALRQTHTGITWAPLQELFKGKGVKLEVVTNPQGSIWAFQGSVRNGKIEGLQDLVKILGSQVMNETDLEKELFFTFLKLFT